MKTAILTAAFALLAPALASAQSYFSCNKRTLCSWDSQKESFSDECSSEEQVSMFEINNDETLFKHTTPGMTSTYYIKEKSYDKEKNQVLYTVTSDVGNKYVALFDVDDNEVRFVGNSDGQSYMVTYAVKRSWAED